MQQTPGKKKAARWRVNPCSLGGGGNEDFKAIPPGTADFLRVELLVASEAPGYVPPADRLRAALPVGTNRASHQGERFFVALVAVSAATFDWH